MVNGLLVFKKSPRRVIWTIFVNVLYLVICFGSFMAASYGYGINSLEMIGYDWKVTQADGLIVESFFFKIILERRWNVNHWYTCAVFAWSGCFCKTAEKHHNSDTSLWSSDWVFQKFIWSHAYGRFRETREVDKNITENGADLIFLFSRRHFVWNHTDFNYQGSGASAWHHAKVKWENTKMYTV